MASPRGHWASKLGFILAAAGSAVGLGNVWKFPYITGENGGGAFVLIYLACVALVGLPVMMGEVLIGRMTQQSPVGAFGKLSDGSPLWRGFGILGVLTSFVILSYYSVVAGWGLHYLWLSLRGAFDGAEPAQLPELFARLAADGPLNLVWHTVFMALTFWVVRSGVQQGVERAARILMPALFAMLAALLIYAARLPGFAQALDFVFGFHTERLHPQGVLEALGHSFFTLSVGMGAMLTYGSYMQEKDDIVSSSIAITALDTLVSMMACLVLFPITFTFGMQPAAGPGLVFINMPVAFAQLPGTLLLSTVFFLLLVFAALTSAVSLLEVPAAYLIDEHGLTRKRAVTFTALLVFLVGIPSALSNGEGFFNHGFVRLFGRSYFDLFDYLATNWLLPIGGLGVALVMAYRVGEKARAASFAEGSKLGSLRWFYLGWLRLLQIVVPLSIIVVMLHALHVF